MTLLADPDGEFKVFRNEKRFRVQYFSFEDHFTSLPIRIKQLISN
jgi:hypothetical protein